MPKGSRVLMADDDKMLIDMYKERLELAGYIVTLCRNGEEALGKIREVKPDIVLLDIMMPKINGYEALASIKSDPATKDIPVIMLSALMRDFNREKAVEAGADDYLIKSEAMPADVITKIEQVLAKYGKSATLPTPGAISPNIPAPSATPPGPAMTSSAPLPDLPPPEVKSPVEPPVPFVSPSLASPQTTVSTPDTLVMQPDAPPSDQNKIVFTPTTSEEPKKEPEAEKKSEVESDKEPEKEEVPVIKINQPSSPPAVPITQSTPPTTALPWENNSPVMDLSQPEKKERSSASIVLMVVIAILLTILVNDLVIYFFFFVQK